MLVAITTMFCGNIAQVVASWVLMNIFVSTADQTKAEIFIYAVTASGDGWDVLLNATSMMFITSVADGLLVRITLFIRALLIMTSTDMALLQCLG